MPVTRPRMMEIFSAAYWDMTRAFGSLRRMVLIAAGIFLVQLLAYAIVPRLVTHHPVGRLICGLLIAILFAYLLTPFVLAVHRFIVLGEVTTRYRFEPQSLRFKLMFYCLVAFALGQIIPEFLLTLVAPPQPDVVNYTTRPPEPPRNSWALAVLPVLIAVAVITTRLLVLLPAVATDAPGATWQNAFADSKGHFWFTFWVLTLTVLPVLFGIIVLVALLALVKPMWLSGLAIILVTLAGIVLATVLGAAVASRIYLAFGNRLNA